MNCYTHNDAYAIGICKACAKALCMECAHDTGNGLACKDTCIEEVNAVNEIMERTKMMYSIGKEAPMLNSGTIVYFLFSFIFGGWAIYSHFFTNNTYSFSVAMSFGMLAIGIYTMYKQKKLKLDV